MEPYQSSDTVPRIVVTDPPALRDTVLVLTGDRNLVGRGRDCDLRMDDPQVSWTHAVVVRWDGQTTVHDLESTNGTLVNDEAIVGPRTLRHGDMLRFGSVDARYEEPVVAAAQTSNVPAVAGSAGWEPGQRAASHAAKPPAMERPAVQRPAVGLMHPGLGGGRAAPAVNGAVGHYNQGSRDGQYVQQIIAQQDGLLRQVAAAGIRARRLIAIGLGVFALGGGTFAWVLVHLATQISNDVAAVTTATLTTLPTVPSLLGPSIHGVPVGVLGLAVAFIGIFLMIAGVVPLIIAASKRRLIQPGGHQPLFTVPSPHERW